MKYKRPKSGTSPKKIRELKKEFAGKQKETELVKLLAALLLATHKVMKEILKGK